MDKAMITEINKETFWQLIREMKMECGQDMDASVEWMKQHLLQMPPEQSLRFHTLVHGYEDAANQYGLWSVASLIKEYGCSDDGFIDFRAWLIAQGKEIYMAALADPDSLSEVPRYGDCTFEIFSYVGDYAYEEQTGRSAYDDCTEAMRKNTLAEVSQEIRYHPMIKYPLDIPDTAFVYPKIGAQFIEKYGTLRFSSGWQDSPFPEERRLYEEGKREVRKLRQEAQKSKGKPKKREGQSR